MRKKDIRRELEKKSKEELVDELVSDWEFRQKMNGMMPFPLEDMKLMGMMVEQMREMDVKKRSRSAIDQFISIEQRQELGGKCIDILFGMIWEMPQERQKKIIEKFNKIVKEVNHIIGEEQ